MQNSSAHPFQHPTDTNTNTVIPLGGGDREREREARDSGMDEKSNEEWDRWSSHSWLTSSTSTEAECLTNSRPGLAENVPSLAHRGFLNRQPSVTMANYLWEPCLHCITALSRHHCTVKRWKLTICHSSQVFSWAPAILSGVIFQICESVGCRSSREMIFYFLCETGESFWWRGQLLP